MIIEGLCSIFYWIASLFLSILPDFPSFDGLREGLSPLITVISFVNRLIDLRAVSVALVILFVIYNIKFGWSILMWIVRKIPGVS